MELRGNLTLKFPTQGANAPLTNITSRIIDLPWEGLDAGVDFSTSPGSTSRIDTPRDLSSFIRVNMPLSYVTGGNLRFGRVASISSSYLTVQGPPLDGSLSHLSLGFSEQLGQIDLFISGSYGDATSVTMYQDKMKSQFFWDLPRAYCVSFSARHNTGASTTQPKINLLFNGNRVSTGDSGNGIGVDLTRVTNSAVAIDPANYMISPGQVIEIEGTQAGSEPLEAQDLTVTICFVTE